MDSALEATLAGCKRLLDSSLISAEEYELAKARVLNELCEEPGTGAEPKVHSWYRTPAFHDGGRRLLQRLADEAPEAKLLSIDSEFCYYMDLVSSEGATRALDEREVEVATWLLRETFEPEQFGASSFLSEGSEHDVIMEFGPRPSFKTAWCTNAVSVLNSCGVARERMERSRRVLLRFDPASPAPTAAVLQRVARALHDRMTEYIFALPLATFETSMVRKEMTVIPLLAKGREALIDIDKELGLAFDEWDLDYYTELFRDKLGRDPTDVEIFDCAQSNSEHCRHWFFNAHIEIDGETQPESLFNMVRSTCPGPKGNPDNSVIAFHDNSSVIKGSPVRRLRPEFPDRPSKLIYDEVTLNPLLTAETHNFPTGVAPFPGAETGTGGRIRDVQATGRGAYVVAAVAGYCVGNLSLPGYDLPWEQEARTKWGYPGNLALPREIAIDASNGASDYGNKFGEPVICGFARSFGMRLPDGDRREWIKPIMFSAGLGQLDDTHCVKGKPEPGMLVVKIGGPAYRIGMGGGAASSRASDAGSAALDFNAVQRGDAEMENKMNRVVRACIEFTGTNPIVSIHDQGAGGNGNVLKEICEPLGAVLDARKIPSGDPTLSLLELWGAEYQENNALLLRPEDEARFTKICNRERSVFGVLGAVTGDGRVVLTDGPRTADSTQAPVDLPLELVLGKLPRKTFKDSRIAVPRIPLTLPAGTTVASALHLVVKSLAVSSKRWLTNKVDRSVTGLIARQQCVGPLQLPLSDVAVIAQAYAPNADGCTPGAATSVGEQPIKGILDPAAMARLAIAECLTNLVFARITGLRDVKSSVNWMWPAKLAGGAASLYDACAALRDAMFAIGISCDGGKDSLSMAATAPREENPVKSPGQMVVTAYASVPDVRDVVTPDLKCGADVYADGATGGVLVHVAITGADAHRLGGSVLGQVYSQLGEVVPDLDAAAIEALVGAFETTQDLIGAHTISAGHDVSDGGLATTLIEMAFAGNCGIDIELAAAGSDDTHGAIAVLFAEEPGLVLEFATDALAAEALAAYAARGVSATTIGRSVPRVSGVAPTVKIAVGGEVVVEESMTALRDVWESTSFALEMRQANPECVASERDTLKSRISPPLSTTYTPVPTPAAWHESPSRPRVAILREEGSNGDREMAAAFTAAGFEAWDICVRDLAAEDSTVALDSFRGVVFVGGFSFAGA